jgi:hypothetical protein
MGQDLKKHERSSAIGIIVYDDTAGQRSNLDPVHMVNMSEMLFQFI